jgi:hypothetical protein
LGGGHGDADVVGGHLPARTEGAAMRHSNSNKDGLGRIVAGGGSRPVDTLMHPDFVDDGADPDRRHGPQGFAATSGWLRSCFGAIARAALSAAAATAACLAVPAVATAAGAPEVGKYEFPTRTFVDTDTCGFPITVSLDESGTYQLFFDAEGKPTRLVLHFKLVGTDSANGKTLNEINRGTETIDLTTGSATLRGAGLQKLPGGGVVAVVSGLQREADGFAAGRLDLPFDNPEAYCAALS